MTFRIRWILISVSILALLPLSLVMICFQMITVTHPLGFKRNDRYMVGLYAIFGGPTEANRQKLVSVDLLSHRRSENLVAFLPSQRVSICEFEFVTPTTVRVKTATMLGKTFSSELDLTTPNLLAFDQTLGLPEVIWPNATLQTLSNWWDRTLEVAAAALPFLFRQDVYCPVMTFQAQKMSLLVYEKLNDENQPEYVEVHRVDNSSDNFWRRESLLLRAYGIQYIHMNGEGNSDRYMNGGGNSDRYKEYRKSLDSIPRYEVIVNGIRQIDTLHIKLLEGPQDTVPKYEVDLSDLREAKCFELGTK